MKQTPIWQPQTTTDANLTHFIHYVGEHYGISFHDYPALYQWSITHKANFWASVWDFCHIIGSQGDLGVVQDPQKMPGARWFPGARLNFAENLLRYRDQHLALLVYDERGLRQRLSYQALYTQVARLAAALQQQGVGVGDRVVGWLPNSAETVIAMLATTSMGAMWSSCSPDFGGQGVYDRFHQIQPKVLFASDGQLYQGKQHSLIEKITQLAQAIPSLERVVMIPHLAQTTAIDSIAQSIWYQDFLSDITEITFERYPFDHPIYILYSSGTTGMPKCIVHGAGGTLIQHLKELVLHTDLKRDDTICYYTTCGWMMWNWLVSSLAVGATLVLYDGATNFPKADSLLALVDTAGVSIFGTSAKYLSMLEKQDAIQPRSFPCLRTILSTGSPLNPSSFDYVYQSLKSDVMLCSISGGTDIVSCFALGNPLLPIYRGELQCRGLGMDVDVFTENAEPLRGQPGELVCKSSFPAMPIYFWNDATDEAYHQAYFARFPHVWAHGDYAELTEHDGLIIHGRSDATLNPGGVRIGTAEIYRQVETIDAVLESIVVEQQWQDDTRLVLFVKLREAMQLTPELTYIIKQTIRTNTSPRHVPNKILQVNDIPKTISGKLVELAVRQVIHNQPVKNIASLANPQALQEFTNRPELQE